MRYDITTTRILKPIKSPKLVKIQKLKIFEFSEFRFSVARNIFKLQLPYSRILYSFAVFKKWRSGRMSTDSCLRKCVCGFRSFCFFNFKKSFALPEVNINDVLLVRRRENSVRSMENSHSKLSSEIIL